MIDKLEVGKKYRLIDKEGFLHHDPYCNEDLISKYDMEKGFILGWTDNTHEEGFIGGSCVIASSEHKFFEEVVEGVEDTPPEDNLWNGNLSTLGAGVTVTLNDSKLNVLFYRKGGNQVLLESLDGNEVHVSTEIISAAIKSEEEVFKEAVFEKYKRKSLDYAHTTLISTARIDEMLDAAWKVIQEGGENK